ncbi:MAG TPA: outer membrane beta-barrel protein [Steroidobacteraceae bacterium]|nr:outer membrane beta-barrel protein [Steroidobacteraceae bacterium]
MRKWIFSGSAAAAALLFLAGPARAEEPQRYNDWEFTPFIGFMGGGEFEDPTDGSNRDLDEDTDFGLIVDAAADYWRHYELLYARMSTKVDGTAPFDLDVQYLQIGGTVSYPDATRVIPYFGLTVGAARFSPDAPGLSDETKIAFSVAGGVRVPITQNIGVRLDLRGFVTLLDAEGDLFCASSAGLTCNIRAKSDTFVQYSANLGVTIGF